jgi:hypothetical protein
MLDKATVLTTLFTIGDDTMKGSAMIQQALKRPGPAPHLSDSEVISIALYQELIGEPREDHFFRLHHASLREVFPGLNERSRDNRRKRDLWAVILAVRVSLQLVLEALQLEKTAAIDSAPMPCVSDKRSKQASEFVGMADYGECSSKAMKYFGCKWHTVVSLSDLTLGFLLTPASRYDNQPEVELLDSFAHHLKQLNRLRLICETVNAQLQEQLHLSKHYAKSTWGLFTRIAAKMTAHSVGMMVNLLLGRPALKLADLAL